MKKTITLFISIIMVLLLAACGANVDTGSSGANVVPSTSQNASTSKEAGVTSAPTKITINLDYASDELLAKADEYNKYDDTDSKYRISAVFKTNVAVDGFKYVSLNYDDSSSENGDTNFKVEKVLYTPSQLTPEKPLVVTMLLDGAIPSRGIAYTDENGTTRYFAISMSGQDDSLLLTEFTPLN